MSARTSVSSCSCVGMRRSRHWREIAENSHSIIFNQLPGLRRVIKLEALCQRKSFLRREGFVEGTQRVRVQVVLNHPNLAGLRKKLRQFFEKERVFLLGALRAHMREPLSGERFDRC